MEPESRPGFKSLRLGASAASLEDGPQQRRLRQPGRVDIRIRHVVGAAPGLAADRSRAIARTQGPDVGQACLWIRRVPCVLGFVQEPYSEASLINPFIPEEAEAWVMQALECAAQAAGPAPASPTPHALQGHFLPSCRHTPAPAPDPASLA